MLMQGQDGELRISDWGAAGGATHYIQILFTEMDFSAPTSRPLTEETLILDRNKADSNMHYIQGPDTPIYDPIAITFTCKIADTSSTQLMVDWLSGVTRLPGASSGLTQLYSWKGKTTISGNSLPAFADSTGKYAYKTEIKWDASSAGTDIGYQYNEVFFTPGEQTITEAPDGVTLNVNGQIYGGVSRINSFDANTTLLT